MNKILAYMFLMLNAFFVLSGQPLLWGWSWVWMVISVFFYYNVQIINYLKNKFNEIF